MMVVQVRDDSRMDSPSIQMAARNIASADALIILTGAGMSVDAGLQDFRGSTGLWRGLDAMQRWGRPSAFRDDPMGAWAFYAARANAAASATPHAGYYAVAELAARCSAGAFVLTSNVDGLHRKAGWPTDRLNEAHGRLDRLQCAQPCSRGLWPLDAGSLVVEDGRLASAPPSCPACGAIARPAVNLLGDDAWINDDIQGQDDRLAAWLSSIKGAKSVVLEVGAGTKLPVLRINTSIIAQELKAHVVRINLNEPTPAENTTVIMQGAEAALVAIASEVRAR